jgi:spore germination cell wall hydrolase CwlJ-like protein
MKTLKTGILAAMLLVSLTLATGTLAPVYPVKASTKDIECLAKNIYHESRGESLHGKIAVAQVTVNRVNSKLFHNTVCGVVYAPSQFSWTLDKTKRVRDTKAWQSALEISRAVLTQTVALPNFTATYFHTRQVKPYWAKTKTRVAVIGNHIFYS